MNIIYNSRNYFSRLDKHIYISLRSIYNSRNYFSRLDTLNNLQTFSIYNSRNYFSRLDSVATKVVIKNELHNILNVFYR